MLCLSWRRASRWLAVLTLLAWGASGWPPDGGTVPAAALRPTAAGDPSPVAWPELPWRRMRVLEVETGHRLVVDTTGDDRAEQVLVEMVAVAVPGGHARYYRVRVLHASRRTFTLYSPLTAGEALADAALPPLGVRVVDLLGEGAPFIVVAGRGGGTAPVYLYRWDGEGYAVALARAFRGDVRLAELGAARPGPEGPTGPAVVGVEPVGPAAAGDGLEVTYRWNGARFVPVRVEPRFRSDGGRQVAKLLASMTRAYLSILPPDEAREWFTTRFWQAPDGWARWRSETAAWLALHLTAVSCCEPWLAEGVVWRDAGGRLERQAVRIASWLAVEDDASRIDRLEVTVNAEFVWRLGPEEAAAVRRVALARLGLAVGPAARIDVLELGPTPDGRVRVRAEVRDGGPAPAGALPPPRRYDVWLERMGGRWKVVGIGG